MALKGCSNSQKRLLSLDLSFRVSTACFRLNTDNEKSFGSRTVSTVENMRFMKIYRVTAITDSQLVTHRGTLCHPSYRFSTNFGNEIFRDGY